MDSSIINALIGAGISLLSMLVTFATIRLTAKNDRGTYISKAKFDKEFEIYQELSEKNLNAVYAAGDVVPIVRGLYDDEPEKIQEHIEQMCAIINDAEFSNKKYAPFINKEIYQSYKELENMIRDIFTMFKFWKQKSDFSFLFKGQSYKNSDARKYIEDKQKEVSKLSDKILDNVREYLSNLDVIE